MIVGVNNENAEKDHSFERFSIYQLAVRNDDYIPINISTVDKVITMSDQRWEKETYVIQMFSSLLELPQA